MNIEIGTKVRLNSTYNGNAVARLLGHETGFSLRDYKNLLYKVIMIEDGYLGLIPYVDAHKYNKNTGNWVHRTDVLTANKFKLKAYNEHTLHN